MRAILLLTALLGVACAGDDGEALPEDCEDAPVVTWASFGQDFTRENCQSCHASTSANRNGAPAEVVFDTEQDVLDWADRVLERAGAEPPTMPPRGGLEADDQERLRIWLECGD